jgi:hypothetical protein
MKTRKERTPEEKKAEYLKRIKSPAYIKNVKRNMQMFETYNVLMHKGKLKKGFMRSAASYFADDIRNPVTRMYQVTEGSNAR